MGIPQSRFSLRSGYYKKRKKGKLKFFLLLLLLVGASAGLYFLLSGKTIPAAEKSLEKDKSFEQLWNEKSYRQLSQRCDALLSTEPLDPIALVYGGFSYFYLGISQFTQEESLVLMSKSIVYLRKALLLKPVPLKSKVEYILGKAYYSKGRYFLDLSIKYMEQSINDGLINDDSYKYLGLAYSELGLYNEGVDYFLKALESKPDDMLYLVLGQTYYKMNDDEKAESYLEKALTMTEKFSSEQKIRFILGKIFLDRGDYKKADEQYRKILEKNINSADAHYYLGEIYSKLNKKVKARAEWRKALEINPSHYGALLRLY